MKFLTAFFALLATCLANPMPSKDAAPVKCGLPAIKPETTNIVGGKDAIPYSWPWQAALFTTQFGRTDYYCGGTLISPQWIMTAGHCFDGFESQPSMYSIKLGVFNESKNNELGELVLNISEIHIHPDFNFHNRTYDITLLKLEKPVEYTDHISPICLPEKQNETLPDAGSTVFTTGWGDTAESDDDSDTLKQITIPLVDMDTCNAAYPGQIYENVMFCAGLKEGGKGACNGDSGGPVVYQDAQTGVWKQLGIISWAHGCDLPDQYGVSSKVSAFMTFIHQYVKDL